MSGIIPIVPLSGRLSPGGKLSGSISAEGCISGSVSSDIQPAQYPGPYSVKPRKVDQILPTQNKMMTDDLEVEAINYLETDNPMGGKTVNIGYE